MSLRRSLVAGMAVLMTAIALSIISLASNLHFLSGESAVAHRPGDVAIEQGKIYVESDLAEADRTMRERLDAAREAQSPVSMKDVPIAAELLPVLLWLAPLALAVRVRLLLLLAIPPVLLAWVSGWMTDLQVFAVVGLVMATVLVSRAFSRQRIG